MCLTSSDAPEPAPTPDPAPAPERTAEKVGAPKRTVDARANQARLGLDQLRIPLESASTLSI